MWKFSRGEIFKPDFLSNLFFVLSMAESLLFLQFLLFSFSLAVTKNHRLKNSSHNKWQRYFRSSSLNAGEKWCNWIGLSCFRFWFKERGKRREKKQKKKKLKAPLSQEGKLLSFLFFLLSPISKQSFVKSIKPGFVFIQSPCFVYSECQKENNANCYKSILTFFFSFISLFSCLQVSSQNVS